MELEFRLRKILKANGLGKHGIYTRIANEAGLTRKTVRDVLLNRRSTVSLEIVGRICGWLREQGLCADPAAEILGERPSGLLRALAEPGIVTIYQGAYQKRNHSSYISCNDSAVDSILIKMLSSSFNQSGDGKLRGVRIEHVFVPNHLGGKGNGTAAADLRRNSTSARELFKSLRGRQSEGSAVLIGSQRANHLVELFVADLMKLEPFIAAPGTAPFYLLYPDARGPSCFGGADLPAGCAGQGPGIYYRTGDNGTTAWHACPSRAGKSDAGIVITRRDPGEGRMEMATFGYSGQATAALSEILRENPDLFWPTTPPARERRVPEVQVYVVRFDLATSAQAWTGAGGLKVTSKDVIPLA